MIDIARGDEGAQPLVSDSDATNRATGSFIVIDEAANNNVAAGDDCLKW